MVGEAGIEPTTPGLEGRCSIRLSYSPGFLHCNFEAHFAGELACNGTCKHRQGRLQRN
jgi:hypothetical protein